MTSVVYVALGFILVSIIIFIIALKYLMKGLGFNESTIKEFEWKLINDVVDTAVRMAEQTVKGVRKGKTKKQLVISLVNTWLADYGIVMKEDQIDALIEASVYVMNEEGTVYYE